MNIIASLNSICNTIIIYLLLSLSVLLFVFFFFFSLPISFWLGLLTTIDSVSDVSTHFVPIRFRVRSFTTSENWSKMFLLRNEPSYRKLYFILLYRINWKRERKISNDVGAFSMDFICRSVVSFSNYYFKSPLWCVRLFFYAVAPSSMS